LPYGEEKETQLGFHKETKLRQTKMECIRLKLGFSNMFMVDCMGKSGGLSLLWDKESGIEIQNFSQRHINATIHSPTFNTTWKFTSFYGHPEAPKRHETWALLRLLANYAPKPWVCIGDFNEVVSMSEKWGGNVRRESQMRDFRLALEDCELTGLGYCGPKFTWSNCRDGSDFIKERLDRGVANHAWRSCFPEAVINVQAAISSDHAPLFLSLKGSHMGTWRRTRFSFEASWALDASCQGVLQRVWDQSRGQEGTWDCLEKKLDACV
jgi:hypothetical protein